MIGAQSVPAWRRGIRRQFDETRQAHVLLGPERVIVLDDIALAIAELVDGETSAAAIAAVLAARFEAAYAEVEADVIAFLQELAEKGVVA